MFIVLQYLFAFTNNIPCELKLCPTYIEAQTKLVCQQVVQKNYNRVKAPKHHYVTMAKHNSNACSCLYPSNSSIQQPDSQVNNCSMCPPWTWTTAFNRGRHTNRHLSTALLISCWSRLAQQVHTLSLRSSKPTIHRTELRDIPVNFPISLGLLLDPGARVVFLTAYQFSYTPDILLRSLSRPLPAWERSSSLSQSCAEDVKQNWLPTRRKKLRKLFTNNVLHPHPFSWRRSLIDDLSSFVKGMFINKLCRINQRC